MPEERVGSPQAAAGPPVLENWRATLAGVPSRGALEYVLFTDVHVTGQMDSGYGPYRLLNGLASPLASEARPGIVLRAEIHYEPYRDLPGMDKTEASRYHGGDLAEEVSALFSLSLGFRLKAGDPTRRFDPDGDPRGQPQAFGLRPDPLLLKPAGRPAILPRTVRTVCLNDDVLVRDSGELSAADAIALVRSGRLYQDALWVSESNPEHAWILLVSAVEAAAGHWRKDRGSPAERLRVRSPEFVRELERVGGEKLVEAVAAEFVDTLGATKNFVDFLFAFLPGAPEQRPLEWQRVVWEEKALSQAFRKIYDWRSRALHDGITFPAPMCQPPMRVPADGIPAEKPLGIAAADRGGVWLAEDTPMLLHVFEYIARSALRAWWNSLLPSSARQS